MKLDGLKLARRTVTGLKQTQKAVENGKAKHVFIARNADESVTRPVLEICTQKGIPVTMVETMAELGKACCIKVQAAMAAVLVED
ncbi:MAG: L7Ae/L30e/S12e/Gadd45 family ribosomal protein [Dethiobacter sp.]